MMMMMMMIDDDSQDQDCPDVKVLITIFSLRY
jgi:hypothetical protein